MNNIIEHHDEYEFANGQSGRDLRDNPDASQLDVQRVFVWHWSCQPKLWQHSVKLSGKLAFAHQLHLAAIAPPGRQQAVGGEGDRGIVAARGDTVLLAALACHLLPQRR